MYIFKMVKLQRLQQPEGYYCCDTFRLLVRFILLLKPVCWITTSTVTFTGMAWCVCMCACKRVWRTYALYLCVNKNIKSLNESGVY